MSTFFLLCLPLSCFFLYRRNSIRERAEEGHKDSETERKEHKIKSYCKEGSLIKKKDQKEKDDKEKDDKEIKDKEMIQK